MLPLNCERPEPSWNGEGRGCNCPPGPTLTGPALKDAVLEIFDGCDLSPVAFTGFGLGGKPAGQYFRCMGCNEPGRDACYRQPDGGLLCRECDEVAAVTALALTLAPDTSAKHPGFQAQAGRAPIAGQDYDPDGAFCTDDYEYFTGTGRYY